MPVKVTRSRREKPPKAVEPRTLAERAAQHPLLTLREEVDCLFDDFFSGFSLGPFGRHAVTADPFRGLERPLGAFRGMTPKTDVIETPKTIEITAELPGMDEKDVEVTLTQGVLTIEGEKQDERKEEGEDYHLTERSYGSVRRAFRIPETVNADKVEATFEKGVLKVILPKIKTKEKTKKVAIKAK